MFAAALTLVRGFVSAGKVSQLISSDKSRGCTVLCESFLASAQDFRVYIFETECDRTKTPAAFVCVLLASVACIS